MRTPVVVTFADPAAAPAAISRALSYGTRPRGWRASEWAMTKCHARESAESVAAQLASGTAVTLDLFDWGVLQSELARLYLGADDAQAMGVYEEIKAGIAANPDAARRLARDKEYAGKVARADELRAQADALEREMRQEDADAALARRLAALPCGGCRKEGCSHCDYALGRPTPPTKETDHA